MITYYGDGELLNYRIIEWTGHPVELAEIDRSGIRYLLDGESITLLAEEYVDGRLDMTRLTYLEPGDRIVLTPLGWLICTDEIETLLENTIGRRQ